MFCHQCGEEIREDSKFCSSCGAKVESPPLAEGDASAALTETAVIETAATSEAEVEEITTSEQSYHSEITSEQKTRADQKSVQQQSLVARLLPVLLPVASIILVAIGLVFYYFQQQGINEEVLQLKESAEEVALKGDYKKAESLLEKALLKRPNYSVLKEDLEIINRAIDYEKSLSQISESIKTTQFEAASKDLANLKEKLNEEQSPLFELFQSQVEEKDIKITVGTIKKELNELTTVDQLGGKLSILASLPEKEASAVKQEILNKIVQISSNEVESQLADKQFSEAFATIDKSLQYAKNHEKLLALKNRVEQDQSAFEKAEQQRIEQAMEAAAQEDLKNRTAAVTVSDLTVELDEYGDLYIAGEVENVATTSISSISIYYTVYDENGQYLTDGYTSVYPYYLEPGDIGYFEDTYYGVYQNVNVEIDNITWYLN